MKKKIYKVSGFDCVNCALKAEKHINDHEDVEYAHLDYSSDKLHITFKSGEWDVEKLAAVIKEVESDPLEISLLEDKEKETSLFNKTMKWKMFRVVFTILMTLVCIFALANKDLSWVRFSIYCGLIVLIGYDIFYKVFLHIKNRSNIIDHNLLILIASIGSLVLSILSIVDGESNLLKINDSYYLAFDETMEAVLVMTLFQIGSVVEYYTSNKSKRKIANAINLRVEKANLIKGEEIVQVKPEELQINDRIIVKNGEVIPVDGLIEDGDGFIDTSSLTGEYVPIQAKQKEVVFAGYILTSGTLTIKVNKTYENSAINKIVELIANSGEKKSRIDRFVDRFARWYTPVVILSALLTFIIGGLITNSWTMWIHTGLEVLVIGCPCAIVISIPLAYFAGLGLASSDGIVIKGSNYLDELSRVTDIYTDKTGTLTEGYFKVVKINNVNSSKEEMLETLYAAESLSNHPIAKAIVHDIDISNIAKSQINYLEEAGLGTSSTYKGDKVFAGNDKLMNKYGINYQPVNENGVVIYVAKNDKYLGYVVLNDVVKENVRKFVEYIHKQNIKMTLLTGDKENNALQICQELNIDNHYSELLPEEKMKIIDEAKSSNKKIAFIGDGINDAPSIRRSDIGIAMGGIGSDIAIENADVVIMNDDPYKVADAIKISKLVKHVSIFNIAFALLIKVAVMVLAIIFPSWSYTMYIAVFSDTGLTVLLTINSLLIMKRKIK